MTTSQDTIKTTPQNNFREVWRRDYCAPDFTVLSARLDVHLDPVATRVITELDIERCGAADAELVLQGDESLKTLSVDVDGRPRPLPLEGQKTLKLGAVPDNFVLRTEVEVNPEANTTLNGLYRSNGIFCTQCEPEGFRRITWSLDRPDVMGIYEVRIEAPKALAPVLLSNGDCIESGEIGGDRHYAIWRDPFPKPTYLFALVAGDLKAVRDTFKTRSGRNIDLAIYVRDGDQPLCAHAMDSLKQAMLWDEQVYGLEYDLGQFNIVSVDDFNFGAMENKSLNVFNSKYVLADAHTATDTDFSGIQAVIAHEYFHNWTGNRVTCRDWFQLSLKEGLTVFRDHEFSADMGDPIDQRIAQVRRLRAVQFAEDAGPLSHSVRPESYREINNFYTATVYEKGSEVVRMYRSLLGPSLYHKGVDLYFERHDGTAATCEDFLAAMRDVSGVDFSGFENWYSQSGTPYVRASGVWNAKEGTYHLTLEQNPAKDGQNPFLMPINIGLIGRTSEGTSSGPLPLNIENTGLFSADSPSGRAVIHFREQRQDILFTELTQEPVLSVLGGFSAPVILEQDCKDSDLAFLMHADNDGFNRWQTAQSLYERILMRALGEDGLSGSGVVDSDTEGLSVLLPALGEILNHTGLSYAERASLLCLPSEAEIASRVRVIDAVRIRVARKSLEGEILHVHEGLLKETYSACDLDDAYKFTAVDCGRRALLGVCLDFLASGGHEAGFERALDLVRKRRNMTEILYGLKILSHFPEHGGAEALSAFYSEWSDHPLVVNKWLRLHSTADHPRVVSDIQCLMKHPAFSLSNPNKVYSLLGGFAMGNVPWFHDNSGEGIALITNSIQQLDGLNPQVAARIAGVFSIWRKVEPNCRAQLKAALEVLAALPNLSCDTREIVEKSLFG